MKKTLFFENAKLINQKFGIIPLLYGSVGLEYVTGESLNSDDIDVLIPREFLSERFEEFKQYLSENGYVLNDEKEHTFSKNKVHYSYAQIEELEAFANIKQSEIKTENNNGTPFKILSLEQYLKVYNSSIKDGYRINIRQKKDDEKIAFIKKRLKQKSKKPYSKVYVEITNICNMNCSFCHGTSRPPKRMNHSEFETVLNKLRPYTDYIYYHLMGEPLTHPDLEEFIKLSSNMGFKSIITTNGTLLKEKGNMLIESKVHKVSISLHSFEKNDSMQHFEYLHHVADFAKKASSNGIIVVLRLWNNGCEEEKNGRAISFLKSEISGEWGTNSKGLRIRDKLFLEYGDRFSWPDKDAATKNESVFCYGLKDHFGILSDGTVVPCCLDSDAVINLGNIFSQNIEDILNSPRAAAMVKGFENRKATEELCKKCGYAQRF